MSVEHYSNDKDRGKLMYAVENLSQCYFFTTNPTRTGLGYNLWCAVRGGPEQRHGLHNNCWKRTEGANNAYRSVCGSCRFYLSRFILCVHIFGIKGTS